MMEAMLAIACHHVSREVLNINPNRMKYVVKKSGFSLTPEYQPDVVTQLRYLARLLCSLFSAVLLEDQCRLVVQASDQYPGFVFKSQLHPGFVSSVDFLFLRLSLHLYNIAFAEHNSPFSISHSPFSTPSSKYQFSPIFRYIV